MVLWDCPCSTRSLILFPEKQNSRAHESTCSFSSHERGHITGSCTGLAHRCPPLIFTALLAGARLTLGIIRTQEELSESEEESCDDDAFLKHLVHLFTP